jgi:hypothetical protein
VNAAFGMKENISAESGEGSYPIPVKLYVSIFWQKQSHKRFIIDNY